MANMHHLATLASVTSLTDGRYSDLTITCEGRHFRVHKAIVCSASTVLAAECDSKMKEAQSNVIDHAHFDAETVERMISYIYKQTYIVKDNDTTNTPGSRAECADGEVAAVSNVGINDVLIAHVKMYAIGDYYNLPTLQVFAKNSFVEASRSSFQVDGFINVIREVNKHTLSTDRSMRDKLRAIANVHIIELSQDNEFMTDLAELEDVQDFAADMLCHVVQRQVQDTADYREKLDAKDEIIEAYENEITSLKCKLETSEQTKAMQAANAQRQYDDLDARTDRLVDNLMDMPTQCRNSNCDRSWDPLKLETKGNGEWMVRCARCKCKLVS